LALVVVGPEHAVAPACRAIARRGRFRHALECPAHGAAVTGAFDHRLSSPRAPICAAISGGCVLLASRPTRTRPAKSLSAKLGAVVDLIERGNRRLRHLPAPVQVTVAKRLPRTVAEPSYTSNRPALRIQLVIPIDRLIIWYVEPTGPCNRLIGG